MARDEFDSATSIPKVENALGLLHGTTPKIEAAIATHKKNNDSKNMMQTLERRDAHHKMIKQHENLLGLLKSGDFDKHVSTARDIQKAEAALPPRPTRESTPKEWDDHADATRKVMGMRGPIERLMGSIPPHAYNKLSFPGLTPVKHWSDAMLEDAQNHHSSWK